MAYCGTDTACEIRRELRSSAGAGKCLPSAPHIIVNPGIISFACQKHSYFTAPLLPNAPGSAPTGPGEHVPEAETIARGTIPVGAAGVPAVQIGSDPAERLATPSMYSARVHGAHRYIIISIILCKFITCIQMTHQRFVSPGHDYSFLDFKCLHAGFYRLRRNKSIRHILLVCLPMFSASPGCQIDDLSHIHVYDVIKLIATLLPSNHPSILSQHGSSRNVQRSSFRSSPRCATHP